MLKAFAIGLWMIMHPGHITMTSIEYVQDTDSLKVSCRMYFDDFLKDLQTIDDDRNLKAIFSKQPFPTDLINQYFNSKVFIYINRKLLIGKLLTANLNDNEIVMNLIYKSDKKPKSITVRNLILTGWFSDQTNLTIIKINNFEKGIKLTPEHDEETFILK
jgi:Domain of unknown function (DUF6702)